MVQTADVIFRDFATDGIPASGKHEPRKVEIREWGTALEAFRDAGLASGSSAIYDTRANLEANIVWVANTLAWVIADPVAANNGIYRKIGSSGTGSWSRVGELPYSFIRATDAGVGTPDAIQATSSIPVSSSALVALNIFEANTGSPVTVSFNGGTALAIKTNSGNDIAPGGLAAGMIVAGYVSGSTFRLISDQASAAIVAAAEAAQEAAEEARDQAIAAAATVSAPKATLALAIADDPAVDPEYYEIAYFDTAYQTGSGAKWRKVASDPGLVAGAAFQNANGAWYVNDAATLRPEQFGRCGVDATGDTAAWVRLAAEANRRTKARVVAEGLYDIAGSTIVFDGSLTKLNLRLLNAEFFQQNTFSKTLRFANIPEVRVHGGYFEGLGGGSGEYSGPSSSYNGVAALHFQDCEKVWLSNCSERLHAGGGFVVYGGRIRRFENIDSEGIGYPFIDPIGQGNQGNGSDFSIQCQPSANTDAQLFLFEDTYINVRAFGHAFGVMSVATRRLKMRGCDIGPNPGQHNVYLIDCDGLDIQTNTFTGPRQQCIKNQYENYTGLFLGSEWAAATVYTLGQRVRYQSNGYVVTTAHTSSGSFNSANFTLNPLSLRDGGIVSGNTFDGDGGAQSMGFALISTSLSDGRYIFTQGLICQGNIFRNFVTSPIYWDRALDCDLLNNTFDNCQQASLLRDFRGRIAGNTVRNSTANPFTIGACGTVYYEDNKHIDCGLGGTSAESRVPTLNEVGRVPATQIPDIATTPKVKFRRNEIEYTGSEGGSVYLFFGQTAIDWEVTETRYNGTTQLGRVEGTVSKKFRNDFSGYNNTAQNEPTYTLDYSQDRALSASGVAAGEVANVLCTFINDMVGKQIVKRT